MMLPRLRSGTAALCGALKQKPRNSLGQYRGRLLVFSDHVFPWPTAFHWAIDYVGKKQLDVLNFSGNTDRA